MGIISVIFNDFGIFFLPVLYQFFPLSHFIPFSSCDAQVDFPIHLHDMNLSAVSPFFPAAQACARTIVGSRIKYLNVATRHNDATAEIFDKL